MKSYDRASNKTLKRTLLTSRRLAMRYTASKNMDRTNSMGLWTQSKSYLMASNVLQTHSKNKVSDPNYYLPAHALELALKAFLRGNGATLKCLRELGHDLEACLERAQCFGLESFCLLSKQEIAAIRLLNGYYKAKEFEYIITGSKQYPAIKTIQDIVSRILQKISKFCYEKRGLSRDLAV